MGPKSYFSNGLKHRKHGTSPSRAKSHTLPLKHSRPTTSQNGNRRRIIKVDFLRKILRLLIKLVMCLAALCIVSFLLYMLVMSLYNGRSVRDPCMVDNTSREKIQQFLSVERDFTIQKSDVVPDSVTSVSITFDPKVPKLVHQQWKTEIVPDKFMKWRKKWLEYFPEPEYQHMLWTDDKGRELIENHYPWFLPTYDGYEHNINRADAARYFILYHYGGIYADLDYEPTTNFYGHLPQNQVAMVESPYYWNEKTQNCLMSSPKNDPFWVDLFTVLTNNAKKEEVLEATGPILLDQAMEYSTHPSYILPCENFQRVPLGEYDQTLWTTIYDREIMFRLKPISKHCGYYSNNQCHFGKHHNTVSYRTTSGKVL